MHENLPPTDEELSQLADRQYSEDVINVAGRSHEQWQDDWITEHKLPDGSIEPRIKPTTDQEWINAHNGVAEVDIASTSFKELPKDRQAESMASAVIAVEDVYKDAFLNDYIKIYDTDGEAALHAFATSDKIHQGWLERNSSWATEEQKLPFAQLSDVEKAKDLDFHHGAVEEVLARIKDRSFEVPDALLSKWLSEDIHKLALLRGDSATFGDISIELGGWVHIKMKDTDNYIDLDGKYPLATITQLINGEVQSEKENKNKLSIEHVGKIAVGY